MKSLIFQKNINYVAAEASTAILNGGIAILPFDTVYGFVCDPRNEAALQKIYELKKRPEQKTIGLAATNIEALKSIAELNKEAKKYIEVRAPGRYTFILKKLSWIHGPGRCQPEDDKGDVSDFCVQNGTVGARIPDSPLILKIAEACGGIIAQTSANISGQPNCLSIDDIKNQYGDISLAEVDIIVDGGTLENIGASKLVDLTSDQPKEIERK